MSLWLWAAPGLQKTGGQPVGASSSRDKPCSPSSHWDCWQEGAGRQLSALPEGALCCRSRWLPVVGWIQPETQQFLRSEAERRPWGKQMG